MLKAAANDWSCPQTTRKERTCCVGLRFESPENPRIQNKQPHLDLSSTEATIVKLSHLYVFLYIVTAAGIHEQQKPQLTNWLSLYASSKSLYIFTYIF